MENINDTPNKALVEKDIDRIRSILSGFITADQGFSQGILDEKLRYCKSRGVSEDELFVPFEGEALNENSAEWDTAYFARQRTKFDANFSRERLEHLRKVGKKLFPASDKSEKKNPSMEAKAGRSYSGEVRSRYSGYSRTSSSNNNAIGCAIVGGGVGLIVGGIIAAASGTAVLGGVLIGGIAGAAVGAGVGTVLD